MSYFTDEFVSQGFAGKYLEKERPTIWQKISRSVSSQIIITQDVQFADVSFYQGVIDWDKYKTQTDAVIIRAGQRYWPDTQFTLNWSEAKRVGLKRGAYWFYDDRESPGNQAKYFVQQIGTDYPEMELFIDYELVYGGAYQGLGEVVSMMQEVERLLPNVKVGIYTGYYFFNDHVESKYFDYLKSHPLWLAWYTSNPAYVQIPAPWTKVTHWQWGTPVWGTDWGVDSLEIDMNWYNGTLAEFNQNYGGAVEPPPIEPPPGGNVNVREFSNGVVITENRAYETDYKVTYIPSAAIKDMTWEVGTCRDIELVPGDFVFNATPFDSQCRPTFGLKTVDGVFHNYVPYNPFVSLDNNKVYIGHKEKEWNNYQTSAQFWRYIIENGQKNAQVLANPDGFPDWNQTHPRRLIGMNTVGDLIVILSRGYDVGQIGFTLHQACEIGLAHGCTWMVDGDSGISTQETIVINGVKEYDIGAPTWQHVAVYGSVNFKEPLTDGTTPPPTTGEKMLQYDANGTLVRTWIPG